jgi:hypothetical protein
VKGRFVRPRGGPEIKKEKIMIHLNSNRNAGTIDRPLTGIDPDALILDDEFDDALDRDVFDIRESLSDFRNC